MQAMQAIRDGFGVLFDQLMKPMGKSRALSRSIMCTRHGGGLGSGQLATKATCDMCVRGPLVEYDPF